MTSSPTPATPTATRPPGLPLRGADAQLVQDLHPHDRGPKGTHHGAIIGIGCLYCPATPRTLPELGPLARTATKEQAADQDRKTAELARYKPGRLTADDADGCHGARRGTYRIIYRIEENTRTVHVFDIDHRAELYRPRS